VSDTDLITEDSFLLYAKKIMGQKKIPLPEEECRTAISRAYYSLYHTTGSVLKKKYSFQLIKEIRKSYSRIDLTRINRLDKKYLRSFNLHRMFFLTLLDLGFRTTAFRFKDFRSKRNDADYDLDLNFNATYSSIIVNEIEKLMTQIRQL